VTAAEPPTDAVVEPRGHAEFDYLLISGRVTMLLDDPDAPEATR
jgi:hypothetical protein